MLKSNKKNRNQAKNLEKRIHIANKWNGSEMARLYEHINLSLFKFEGTNVCVKKWIFDYWKKSESSKVKGITTKNYVANRFNNAMFFLELNTLEMDCLFSANEFSHFNNQLSRYEKKTNTQQSGSMQLPAALFMYKAIQQSIEEHSPTREPMFHGCTLICVNQWLCFIRTNHPD